LGGTGAAAGRHARARAARHLRDGLAQGGGAIAESSGTAQSLQRAGVARQKVVVVPNALSSDAVGSAQARAATWRRALGLEDAFVLGCLSSCDRDKRLDVVIDAMGHVDESVALVIAGDGDDLERLRPAQVERRIDAEVPYLLTVSTIEPRTNHLVLLEAFAKHALRGSSCAGRLSAPRAPRLARS
jgi:glycosyltransferase involved in cell wall biosynthesis